MASFGLCFALLVHCGLILHLARKHSRPSFPLSGVVRRRWERTTTQQHYQNKLGHQEQESAEVCNRIDSQPGVSKKKGQRHFGSVHKEVVQHSRVDFCAAIIHTVTLDKMAAAVRREQSFSG